MKKIIAREGLIFLVMVIVGGLCYFLGRFSIEANYKDVVVKDIVQDPGYQVLSRNSQSNVESRLHADITRFGIDPPKFVHVSGLGATIFYYLGFIGRNLLLFGYPFYLIFVRFPIWALKTLREKK